MQSGFEEKCVLKKRSRGWAYTVFNYTDEQYDNLKNIVAEYHVYAKEVCPETSREHIQGYIYFKDVKAGTAVQKYMKLGSIHIEPQGKYSSPKANRDYIVGPYNRGKKVKEANPTAVEIGELPVQGTRKDLIAFRESIKQGMTKREAYDEYPNLMACYNKMFAECRALYLEDKAWSMYESGEKPIVKVIYGPTGIGKTRAIYDKHGRDVYKLEIGDGSVGSTFWNGYDGQDVILIDDFYGQLKLDYLLRILDRYPQQFNTKGGYTWRTARYIYITSNSNPEEWYKGVKNVEVKKALLRRFDEIQDLNVSTPIAVPEAHPTPSVNKFKDKKTQRSALKMLITEKYKYINQNVQIEPIKIQTYDEMIDELRMELDV